MPQVQDKQSLISAAQEGFQLLVENLEKADIHSLELNFLPSSSKSKCATFEHGENMRDVLMHIYEWQRLQVAFVENIRKGTPKDFIPEPYRKNYKEMDEANRQRHQGTSVSQAIAMLKDSHAEIMVLLAGFSEEELFGKKVFKVTYTTTMAAYFSCVTVSPYGQALKKLKSHLKSLSKK